MAVAHLTGEPARIGGASAQRARDLLLERRTLATPGDGRVEMVERRIGARLGGGRGETAFMLGERVGVERVLARQILGVNKASAPATRARNAAAASRASPSPS